MNTKMIRKYLKTKHDQFCESIDDPHVRELVKQNSIITGGAIVSLLTNEKVNDLDYYFTNKETAVAVAEYYIKLFCELNPKLRIQPVLKVEEDRVKIYIASSGITSEESDDDYAFFETRTHDEAEAYVDKMMKSLDDTTAKETKPTEEEPRKYRPVFLSANAITLSNEVQLVVRFYGPPEKIHESFDFVHCTNYWTSKDNKLTLVPKALESILTRDLFYRGSLYPLCSVIRTRKFIKRGWNINAGQYLKMFFQINELNLNDISVLQDQLTGVDAAYFAELLEWCRKDLSNIPDFTITMPYICKIVDEIFDR